MKQMKRRDFIIKGGTAILLMQSQLFLFGPALRKNQPNILFINLASLSHLKTWDKWGRDNLNLPGINRLREIGNDLTESFSTHPDRSELAEILQDSGYRNFHVGFRDLPGKTDRKDFTVLHEGGCCGELNDQDVTSGARSFLRNYAESHPFFLSVAYLNPGESYLPDEENYNRSVERTDLEIELLLEEVERSHWKENTKVLYTRERGKRDSIA